jgi:membrane associated rhomboid family serine protease
MQAGFQAPPLTKTNKILIITLVVFFVLSQITKGALGSYLALSLSGMSSGLFYQLITYPFIEASFMGLLFEGLLLWFIGSELESKWGRKFYIEFFLVSVLSVAPLYLILSKTLGLSAPLMGITGFNYALLVAYAIIYSERQLMFMMIFPMKAKYFCMLLAGIQLYTGFFSGSGAVSFTHLAAMLFAFMFLQYKSAKARGVSLGSMKQEMHKKKMKSKLRIVTDEEPMPPKDKADPKDPKFWQ